MNKEEVIRSSLKSWVKRIDGRLKDIFLLASIGLILILATWQLFHADGEQKTVAANATEMEIKVIRLLEEIDGVGEANVIVYETEEGAKNVVVVCEGAKNLRVVMNVREAVAAALGTEEKAVKIYLKKE